MNFFGKSREYNLAAALAASDINQLLYSHYVLCSAICIQ